MKSFFRLALLGLVLVIVALVSMLTAMRLAIHGREVAVPDLTGKTPVEGKTLAEQNGFTLEIERQYYSPNVPEGRILSQLPPAGMKVRRGWQLRVAQSLGPQRVEIPNVMGQSQRVAEITIRRRGLEVGPSAQIPLSGIPADQVASQSPPPNASGVSVPRINLLISSPAPPQSLVMPSFVGRQLGSSVQSIQDAGLHPGAITLVGQTANAPDQQPSPAIPRPGAGSIIVSQSPAAGEKVTVGSAVNFQVQ